MKLGSLEKLHKIDWGKYLKLSYHIREMTPEGREWEELTYDEMKGIVTVASIKAGWWEEVDEESSEAQDLNADWLNDQHPGNVLRVGGMVYTEYEKIRAPDPNL